MGNNDTLTLKLPYSRKSMIVTCSAEIFVSIIEIVCSYLVFYRISKRLFIIGVIAGFLLMTYSIAKLYSYKSAEYNENGIILMERKSGKQIVKKYMWGQIKIISYKDTSVISQEAGEIEIEFLDEQSIKLHLDDYLSYEYQFYTSKYNKTIVSRLKGLCKKKNVEFRLC